MTVRVESDGSRSHWTRIRIDAIYVTASTPEYTAFNQGSLAVGDATVRLTSASMPCVYVRICAPTADHDAGANTGNILIGTADAGGGLFQEEGGICLTPTNYVGLDRQCSNASQIYLTGFNAGDCIEFQVFNYYRPTPPYS